MAEAMQGMMRTKAIWRLPYGREMLLGLLLVVQMLYWWQVKGIRPELEVVPPPPTPTMVAVDAMGDGEWYFRTRALYLQNFGDTFGRFTPLKKYDYADLAAWWYALDGQDARSDVVAALASYYFSQTQQIQDLRYNIRYLEQHADRDPLHKWWWYANAVYLANHKLRDKPLALRLAYKLAMVQGEDLPQWTRQMPAFIHEQMGEREAAYALISAILQEAEELQPHELNFIRYFLDERMAELGIDVPDAE